MTETEQEYFQICAWRFLHPLKDTECGAVHHIFPRSCGGFDKPFNLVRLTPEEHLRCHRLLVKIFDEKGMKIAKRNMAFATCIMGHKDGVRLSEEEYGEVIRNLSEAQSGEENPFYGKHHTEEHKKRMRELNLGENNPMFGKHLPEETKQRISNSGKGKKHNISEEGMANIRAAVCGRVVKEETKKKLSAARKAYWERKKKCQQP